MVAWETRKVEVRTKEKTVKICMLLAAHCFVKVYNAFNPVLPSMNPQDLSTMVWMAPITSALDENLANYYPLPSVPNAMESAQQPHALQDMSTLISEYNGHVTAIPTPTGIANIPSGATEHLTLTNQELFNLQQHQQHHHQQQQLLQQQLALGYGFIDQNGALASASGAAAVALGVTAQPPPATATLGSAAALAVGELQMLDDHNAESEMPVKGMDENATIAATGVPLAIGTDDTDGIPGVVDGELEHAQEPIMQPFGPYSQMIDSSGGSDYLSSSVTAQESLMHFKLMNDSQLLQGHFLDYDMSQDDGSNSSSSGGTIGTNNNNQYNEDASSSMVDGAKIGNGRKSRSTKIHHRPNDSDDLPPPYPSMYAVQMPERFAHKKIKPFKRPGLVLKTPIAYKGDIDPSVIPIERDGMAICEKCGAIGVKHSFYTKQRRFCSMSCSRSFESLRVFNPSPYRPGNGSKCSITDYGENKQHQTTCVGEIGEGTVSVPPDQLINEMDCASQGANGQIDCKESILLQQEQEELLQQKHQEAEQVQTIGHRFKMSVNNGEGSGPASGRQAAVFPTPSIVSTNVSNNSNNSSQDENLSLTSINSAATIAQEIIPQNEIPQLPSGDRLPSPCPQDDRINSIRRKPNEFHNSYDWTHSLSDRNFLAAPVTCFRHAPGYDMWPNVIVGMKVEVENTDCDVVQQPVLGGTPHSFWVASVLQICGYKALLRYEGFDAMESSKDFWVNLCSAEVHPVGWCATRGKPLIPPKSIKKPNPDWKEFLVKRLSNARTLPSTFYNKISDSFRSRFRVGLNLEVVDKNRISQVKLATINRIVGKRLYVRYYDSPPDDNGFWCHEDSPLIHPVGWATTVGHNLAAPDEYMERMNAASDQILEPNEDDATMDLFKTNFSFEEYCYDGRQTGFEENMKLEAVDPLNLSSICVATVMSVLKFGYIMIRIDSYDPDVNGADWFCYHEKSPCIFPVGFCAKNNITLTPPKGYDLGSFTWEQYLRDTGSRPATEDIFHREQIRQRFQVGMKLESADLMDPRLICVATISRVVGRLLKVHFDGWDDEYDQWLDSESPDIYPIGWCVLVGHKLEGPRILPKIPPTQKVSPKTTKKGIKRKKKLKTEPIGSHNEDCEFRAQPAPTTRTARIKKEQQHFEQQKQLSTTQLEYSAHLTVPPSYQQGYGDVSTTLLLNEHLNPAHGGLLPSSLQAFIKHEPNHDSSTTLLSGTSALGPIFDHSTGADSIYGDERTEDEDGESSSATGLPSTAPSSEIADNELEKIIPRLLNQDMMVVNSNSPDSSVVGSGMSSNSQTNSNGSSGSAATAPAFGITSSNQICPENWEVKDVATFLVINDCGVHSEQFVQNCINGKRLLELSKDDIITLLSLKVGPALKIFDLIQQLKCKIDPLKSRHLAKGGSKKFL
ncbi:polycomb protein Sfmbt isoform X2 [Anopheles aquasalis]|uniref:polycomb protein Sfmbt isoform X2 n=1 Tax=Anopheles aquasalis TaxID=42839 RepID=UPI00215B2FDA|nr:polycomb protein Sfmbt isoform X2 [Anopheles aquasalis]